MQFTQGTIAAIIGTLLGCIVTMLQPAFSDCEKGCNEVSCYRIKTGDDEGDFQCYMFDDMQCLAEAWFDVSTTPKDEDWECESRNPPEISHQWKCDDCQPVCPQIANVQSQNCEQCELQGEVDEKVCTDPDTM